MSSIHFPQTPSIQLGTMTLTVMTRGDVGSTGVAAARATDTLAKLAAAKFSATDEYKLSEILKTTAINAATIGELLSQCVSSANARTTTGVLERADSIVRQTNASLDAIKGNPQLSAMAGDLISAKSQIESSRTRILAAARRADELNAAAAKAFFALKL